ncbi:hypothetical protein H6CHR_01843 [Variovorax sp. PBL-H6]|uniref:SctK family type III secretion system sorting platform protein n=1 Tax=Variovorax sp. PBL-H6 TaxID=434009 RepID=UPI0013195C52|nr:SctK family type III secretion system sorting platform protein [Variovorax sp. PBL-H6]VTU22717.1 hypothetical protein H6CHR_01843 [Variovorax sp. PBL-H6]
MTTPDASQLRGRPGREFAEMRLLMHEFDHWPAEYMDPSRRDPFTPSPVPATLWNNPRARRHLSHHITRTLDLRPCIAKRPGPEWPVALLKADALRQLALHVAAVASSVQVRRSLLREDVVAWREWLTPAPFEFAQRTASLLPLRPGAAQEIDRTLSAESVGLRWLARAAQTWPDPVAQRFLLKMPPGDADSPCGAEPNAAMRLASSVLSIVEPRWCSLLAKNLH